MNETALLFQVEQLTTKRIEQAGLNEQLHLTGIAYRKMVQELNRYQAHIRRIIAAQVSSQKVPESKHLLLIDCLSNDDTFNRMIKLLRRKERRMVKLKARLDILLAEIKQLEMIERIKKEDKLCQTTR